MKAYELLKSEDVWIKGNSATDANGGVVNHNSPDAAHWCAWGAFRRCYPLRHDEYLVKHAEVLTALRLRGEACTLVEYNDRPETTFEDIHSLLKECDA